MDENRKMSNESKRGTTNDVWKAFEDAWVCTDSILGTRITARKALHQPICVRHPYVFYLGHLPAFSWNLLVIHFGIGQPIHKEWDTLFARGIDPNLQDRVSNVAAPSISSVKWPNWIDILNYRDQIRASIRKLAFSNMIPGQAARLLVEHEVMHYETLCYMMAQDAANLPVLPPTITQAKPSPPDECAQSQWIHVPEGTVTLGAGPRPHTATFENFKWDNEYGTLEVAIAPFMISRFPVTVSEFAKFVDENGYTTEAYWSAKDWDWVCAESKRHPSSWRPCACEKSAQSCFASGRWHVLTMDGPVEADAVPDWPVSTSLAEARAYARWAGARLPSEAEWAHMAYGNADVRSSADPNVVGNFGYRLRHAESVHKGTASWCGARDVIGNGWEMTTSVFAPFPGFAPLEEYADYSTMSFGGDHFVLKGASWATDKILVRPTFRNFFRARYPYVFSKFRLCKCL